MNTGQPSLEAGTSGNANASSIASAMRVRNFHQSCEAWLARPALWMAAIATVATLQLMLIVTHRPWLDEWQAVLIARQTPSLGGMLAQLHYEGHPPLWYLILRSAGAILPGDWIMPAVNAALASVGLWAILWTAPLPRVERLLLALNELVIFEFFTISRSLSLGTVLVFLALAFWRSRAAWLALALLPLCDFFFGVIAGALVLVRLRDREDPVWPLRGLGLFIVGGIAAAWTVVPAHDIVSDPARGVLGGTFAFVQQIGTLMLPWQTGDDGPLWNGSAPNSLWLALTPLFPLLCIRSLRGDRLSQALIFGLLGLLFLFGMVIYPVYLRHVALAALLLIALVWLRAARGGALHGLFRLWLCSTAICGLATAAISFQLPFDSAREAALVIRKQHLEDKLWFAFPAYRGIAVAGESGMRFGRLDLLCSSQLMRWNHRTAIKTFPTWLDALHRARKRYGAFYLLTSVRHPLPPSLATRVAAVPAGYDGQLYNLWKIGSGPVASMALPPCVPGLDRWSGTMSANAARLSLFSQL